LFGYGIVRNFLDIGVALTAGDILVNRIGEDLLVHIIVDSFASLIDSSKEAIFMAHETIVLVGSLRLGVNRQESKHQQKKGYSRLKGSQISTSWFLCIGKKSSPAQL
jgi:hypothetical protein